MEMVGMEQHSQHKVVSVKVLPKNPSFLFLEVSSSSYCGAAFCDACTNLYLSFGWGWIDLAERVDDQDFFLYTSFALVVQLRIADSLITIDWKEIKKM